MLNTVLLKAGLLEWIEAFDRWLLIKINSDGSNAFFDAVFPVWRHSDTWMPLYLFLFAFMTLNYGWRAIPWMVMLGFTAGICDQLSSSGIKEWVDRTRPCADPALFFEVNFRLNRCPSSGSFTSSHATNHFGAAMFIYMTMKNVFGRYGLLFFAWAATICYGQVYVGVHYPLDVICGGLLGCAIGYAMAFIFNKQPMLAYKKLDSFKI